MDDKWSGLFSVLVVFACLGGAAWAWHAHNRQSELARERADAERWQYLVQRYGPDVAHRIVRRHLVQGDAQDVVVEMFGAPIQVDDSVLKTRRRQIFKYGQTGRNRFGLRVTLDNGSVVGWDYKG